MSNADQMKNGRQALCCEASNIYVKMNDKMKWWKIMQVKGYMWMQRKQN